MGVDNLIIVDTDDALLIMKKQYSQQLKPLLAKLGKQQRRELHRHRINYRPWGYRRIILESTEFRVNHVVVNADQQLASQIHLQRSEHWVITVGRADVIKNHQSYQLNVGESIAIPENTQHQLINQSADRLELIEIQYGVIDDDQEFIPS